MTRMPEAVSIIVPVFNEEGAIASTIAAIDATMRAEGREYEVLVVDDGSTDGTAQVLAGASAPVRACTCRRCDGRSSGC